MTGGARIRLWWLGNSSARGRRGAASLSAKLFSGIVAALLLACGAVEAEAAKVPPGLIPYDKPVFKNGRRVLYHGPSRGTGKAVRAVPPKGASTKAASTKAGPPKAGADRDEASGMAARSPKAAESAAAPAPSEPPSPVKAGALGAAVAAPAFGAVAPAAATLRLAMDARLGAELARAMAERGVALTLTADTEADLAVTPMPLSPGAQLAPGLAAIARLYDCEAAVVGSAGMTTIADLAGKRVAAPAAASAAGRAARRLFAAAGVAATFVDAPDSGVAAMREGRADGLVAISPAPRIEDAPPGARLLIVPYRGAVREQFLPVELGKAVFPALKDGESVDSVAQPVILAAVDPDRDPGRRAALARFAEAFFSALAAGALPDRKWSDVNPAAKLPFSRFEAARSWANKAWIDQSRPN